jgi:hypothetical protein
MTDKSRARDEKRPLLSPALTREMFERWYWEVETLQAFSRAHGLDPSGVKAELRERVAAYLGGEASDQGRRESRTPTSKQRNSSAASYAPDTIIDASLKFGPKFRAYMTGRLGPKFRCTGEFMAWCRANTGRSLADAEGFWRELQARRAEPGYRPPIARCNNYLIYLRAFQDAFPDLTRNDAKQAWMQKKLRPAQDGFVVFEKADRRFLQDS